MTQALEQRTYTREEYLEFEVASEERHEYVNGEIRLMTGGTPDHNELAINLAALLKSKSLLSMKTLTLMLKSSEGDSLRDGNAECGGITNRSRSVSAGIWSRPPRAYLWVSQVICGGSSQSIGNSAYQRFIWV